MDADYASINRKNDFHFEINFDTGLIIKVFSSPGRGVQAKSRVYPGLYSAEYTGTDEDL